MAAVTTSWLFLFLMLVSGGGSIPLGVPPLPEDPLLTKVAPEECLFYFSSAGMAKPDSKNTNHTEKLFAEPEVRRLASEIEKLIRTHVKEEAKNQPPEVKGLAEDGPNLVKVLLTHPVAFYVAHLKVVPGAPPEVRAGAVVSLGEDAGKVAAALDRLYPLVRGKSREVSVGDTIFHQTPLGEGAPDVTWGVKGSYLYVATAEGELEALLKRAGGSAPKWLTKLHKQLPVERVSTVSMINIRALHELLAPLGGPEVSEALEAFGATGLDRLTGVTGLDKDGYVSRSLVSLRGEPQGVVTLFDQKPLTAADVDLIPRDATFALALKLDAAKAWTTILGIIEKVDPKVKERLTERENAAQRELREELLKALGDSWCIFDSASAGGMFVGVTAVVSVKDAEAAASLEKKLIRLMESAGSGDPRRAPDRDPGRAPDRDPGRRAQIKKFTFGGKTIHVFDAGTKDFPLAPAWCLTDKHLIVAPYPGAIKAFLGRGRTFQGLTKVAEVSAALEGEGQTIALSYVDTRRLFDLFYPFLPVVSQMLATQMRHEGIDLPPGLLPSAGSIRRHLRPSVGTLRRTPAGIETVSRQTLPGGMTPVLIGLLIPAVQKVREASQRISAGNNLRNIGLAMHGYHDAYATLPPAYRANKDGKPLLSWRVLILPYIEQQALYNEFHLDEPWDSAHNKKLIDRMPQTFRSPASNAPPGRTNYLTVRGPNTAFPGDRGVKFTEITDGLSNTIMVVEASDRKAVPWTKPDDYEFNEKDPLDGLVGLMPSGFQVVMCDGSVRFISTAIDPKVLKDLFIRNDGNPPPADK